jgi:hypothetical protein
LFPQEEKRRPISRSRFCFSIFAEADEGARFKLLLRRSASESEYEASVEAFLAFLEAYYKGV